MNATREEDSGSPSKPTRTVQSRLLLDTPPSQAKCDEHLFIFVNINAVFQLLGDLVLEFLQITPRRIGYLGLAFVHAFGASKSLVAFGQKKVRFLHEDIQLMILLEIFLILGDAFALFDEECKSNHFDFTTFIASRAVFILLSSINLLILIKIIFTYKLYHLTYVSKDDPIDKAYFEENEISKTQE